MNWPRATAFLFLMGALSGAVLAQVSKDSLRSYDLSEIVIGGEFRAAERVQRVYKVGLSDLARQAQGNIASTLRLLPSASVQTNSRGETLVYIRSAGERQVALFLDGAPLNVPWDNRIDLSLVPSNILGSISIERGAVSAAYGTNVSGGAVSLQSRRLQSDGKLTEFSGSFGSESTWQSNAMFASRSGSTSILAGASVSSTDGMTVSDDARLPFSQSSVERTNTDRNDANVYLRFDRERAFGSWGLTLLHASAEKGVAPESHLDPGAENVRFWRYPLWRNSMAILNAVSNKRAIHLYGTAWLSRFQQEISQFEDGSYSSRTEEQRDLDKTVGLRFVAERHLSSATIRGITFLTTSSHRQKNTASDDTSLNGSVVLNFRNVLYSSGFEIASATGKSNHWVAGLTVDGLETPDTGDKPSNEGFTALSANLEYARSLTRSVALKLNAGSKPRFPTMRELFGAALNRFIPNPNLKSERAWIAESGVEYLSELFSFEATAFFQRTMDTIDQINIRVDGVRKRKRINLEGSRVAGIEFVGAAKPAERLTINGHFSWMRPVALTDTGERHLLEKPEVLSTFSTLLDMGRGSNLLLAALYTGRAYGLNVDNSQAKLPKALLFNGRLSGRRYFSGSGVFLEMYSGVDNVFDTLQLPQLGLPAAGRTLRIGLNLSY